MLASNAIDAVDVDYVDDERAKLTLNFIQEQCESVAFKSSKLKITYRQSFFDARPMTYDSKQQQHQQRHQHQHQQQVQKSFPILTQIP